MSTAKMAACTPRPLATASIKPQNHNRSISIQHLPAKAISPLTKAPILRTCTHASSAEQASSSEASDTTQAVDILRQARTDYSVPPSVVFQALRSLEQAKLPTEEWPTMVGGTASPGRRWRLVFTSGTKEVQKAMKSAGQGSGKYFPLTAVQRWDSTIGQIENGIFLGHIAALTFSGPYAMKGKKLSFDFDTLKLKVGPWTLPINLKKKITEYTSPPKDPFFLFFYVSDDLIAARGRGGGIAFWARTTPAWELENGVA